MNVISETCDLSEFCSAAMDLDFMEIIDAACVEVSLQRARYAKRTGCSDFAPESREAQYCEDLCALVSTLSNGRFPDPRRPGLVRDLTPLLKHVLKKVQLLGNVQTLIDQEADQGMLLDFDSLAVVVSRDDVEKEDVTPTLNVLKRLLENVRIVRHYRNKVDLGFHGYDEDPRELDEIEEVRRFIAMLDACFPYWLYFLTKYGTGLQAVALCSLPPQLAPDAQPQALFELIERRWRPALVELASNAGWSSAEIDGMLTEAAQYFGNGPQVPEVPRKP